jgi:hypothetical protein
MNIFPLTHITLFTPKMVQWLANNVPGKSFADITHLFNHRFKTCFDIDQIRGACKYRNIFNGRTRKLITLEQQKWLKKNVPGKSFVTTTALFNKRFNTNFAPFQIRGCCNKLGIMTGRRFPFGELPIGTERVWKSRNKVFVKIPDGSWLLKHYAVWEKAHGKVPAGYRVIFLDRNTSNFALRNLEIVSNVEVLQLKNSGLWCGNTEISRTALALVRHNLAIHSRLEKLMGAEEHKKYRCRLCKQKSKRNHNRQEIKK